MNFYPRQVQSFHPGGSSFQTCFSRDSSEFWTVQDFAIEKLDISTGTLEWWISSKSGLIGCCYLFSWKNHDWVRSGVKTTDWPKVKSFKCLIFLPKSWLFIIGIISEKNLNWSIVVIFHILSRYRRISRFTIGISSLFMKWWNLPIWIFCGQKGLFSKCFQN